MSAFYVLNQLNWTEMMMLRSSWRYFDLGRELHQKSETKTESIAQVWLRATGTEDAVQSFSLV